ncbi:MAG: GGDEF domain-containing protein [Bacillota bacterium]
MSNILYRITESGLIKQRYQCNASETIKTAPSIHHFLSVNDFNKIKSAMQANKTHAKFDSVTIDNESYFVYLHQLGIHYLFYARTNISDESKPIITDLIKVFAKEYMAPTELGDEKHDFLFNSIQKLNNELINKQRETVKLNQKLNHLNTILNNRLVKDPLTKLVSRYQYLDEIQREIGHHPNAYGLFWFIDIDNFKRINDTYGHKQGDQFLIEFANRLTRLPFQDTIKMRIAGDEFGLFMGNVTHVDKASIDSYYDTFNKAVVKPIKTDTHTISFTCSVGIAIYNKDTNIISELIDYADFAMYQAKENGKKHYALFDQKTYDKVQAKKYK